MEEGDFSKSIRNVKNNFNGPLFQQGRVFLDSDFNDLTKTVINWQDISARDTMGPNVAAVSASDPDAFSVISATLPDENGNSIVTIKNGKAWVDGLLVNGLDDSPNSEISESDPSSSDRIDRIASYIKSKDQSLIDPIVQAGMRDAVILEVWRESVSAFQELEQLYEPALGGPDTTERVHTATAIRLMRLGKNDMCSNVIGLLPDDKKGTLTVQLQSDKVTNCNCPQVKGGGYTGFEHALFRIEISDFSYDNDQMFKWSQFNGGLVGTGELSGNKITIKHNLQAIKTCGLDEFYLEAVERSSPEPWKVTYGAKVKLNRDEGTLEILDTPLSVSPPTNPFFFRLWNGIRKIREFPKTGSNMGKILSDASLIEGTATERHIVQILDKTIQHSPISKVTTKAEPTELIDGIILQFDSSLDHVFLPRDYWTFEVRVGEVISCDIMTSQHPKGIHYHRVPLAILEWTCCIPECKVNANVIYDCRKIFEPLGKCCGNCTITAIPGDDLSSLITGLKDGGKICLTKGTFLVNAPIKIDGHNNITIEGTGPATKIVIKNQESAFVFSSCNNVTIDRIHVESSYVIDLKDDPHLNGVVTFSDCNDIKVTNSVFKCSPRYKKAQACLRFTGKDEIHPTSQIEVSNCNFLVGSLQIGILLVNSKDANIVFNNLEVIPYDNQKISIPERDFFRNDSPFRFIVKTSLNRIISEKINLTDKKNLTRQLELQSQRNSIAQARKNLTTGTNSSSYMTEILQTLSVGLQGIVCAGDADSNMRIHDNTIRGFIQGIHVGTRVKHPKHVPKSTNEISICRNTIDFVAPSWYVMKQRHGIYVGNADVLFIKDNMICFTPKILSQKASVYVAYVPTISYTGKVRSYSQGELLPTPQTPATSSPLAASAEGIRVYGFHGMMVLISGNVISNVDTGIIFFNLGTLSQKSERLWVLRQNVVYGQCPYPYFLYSKLCSKLGVNPIQFKNRDNIPEKIQFDHFQLSRKSWTKIPSTVLAEYSPGMKANLPIEIIRKFSAETLLEYSSSSKTDKIPPKIFEKISAENMGKIPITTIKKIPPVVINNLSPENLGKLSADFIGNLSQETVGKLSTETKRAFNSDVKKKLGITDI